MANLNCPKCGEEYSDTYRKCPFCQEEAALQKGKPIRRKGKRLDKRKRSGGAGGIILLLAVIIVFGVVGYVFFGEQVADFAGIRTDDDRSDLSQVQGDQQPSGDQQTSQDGTQTPPAEGDATTIPDSTEPAGPLKLDFDTITIPSGQTARLTASGGTGEVTWSTSNEHIATVDGGSVTGVAGGTVTITAKAGEETASCTVTITGDPWVSDVNLSLNKTDVTVRSGDPSFQLKIKGGEHGEVTWSSKNSNVATVSSDGVVKRTGKGTTTIVASVDGQTLECIVRCS